MTPAPPSKRRALMALLFLALLPAILVRSAYRALLWPVWRFRHGPRRYLYEPRLDKLSVQVEGGRLEFTGYQLGRAWLLQVPGRLDGRAQMPDAAQRAAVQAALAHPRPELGQGPWTVEFLAPPQAQARLQAGIPSDPWGLFKHILLN